MSQDGSIRLRGLVEQAERLADAGPTHGQVRPRVRALRTALDEAFSEHRGRAADSDDGARRLTVVGNRALAAALDVHLEITSGLPNDRGRELVQLLLSICCATEEAAARPDDGPSPAGSPPSQNALPLDAFPMVLCAAIAAAIAWRKAEKSSILEQHHLSSATWARLDRHWLETIQGDLQKGATASLADYDRAYLAALEVRRGEITPEHYVQLSLASERGTEEQVLAQLDLPRAALPRVQRAWLRRMSQDKALARRVRALMSS